MVYVYVYLVEYVRECARVCVYDLPQWFHVFAASLLFFGYIFKHVIMNRHGSHNIRIEILWAQTSHSTGTCTATLLVVEL